MNKKQICAIVCLSVGVISAPAWADPSVAEMEKRPAEVNLLKAAVDEMNGYCGTTINITAANFDWPSFKGAANISDDSGHHVGMTCGQFVHDVEMVCRNSDAGKSAVKAKVTNVKCAGSSATAPVATITNKVLVVATPLQPVYDSTAFGTWLKNNL